MLSLLGMPKVKVYAYANCSTCKNALKFLTQKKVEFDEIPIVDSPPTLSELKKMLKLLGGDLKRLFNTSGVLYREMGIAEKLKSLTEAQALALLAANGKLVKRPFVLTATSGLVGFKQDEWKREFR